MKKLIFTLFVLAFANVEVNAAKWDIPTQKSPQKKKKSTKKVAAKKAPAQPVDAQKAQNTADVLNYVFGEKKENIAMVTIKNQSQCDIVVNITGAKNYTANVKANAVERVLVEKGIYTIDTKICEAVYNAQREIKDGIELNFKLK